VPESDSYDYAVVRVVPDLERGEFLNVGVILFAQLAGFLAARIALDQERIATLSPHRDAADLRAHLESIERICSGASDAGPIGELSQSQRFAWLVAPRSTMIQVSAVHSGLSDDPADELERLFARLVANPPAEGSTKPE
jgi:hypothetical protein